MNRGSRVRRIVLFSLCIAIKRVGIGRSKLRVKIRVKIGVSLNNREISAFGDYKGEKNPILRWTASEVRR